MTRAVRISWALAALVACGGVTTVTTFVSRDASPALEASATLDGSLMGETGDRDAVADVSLAKRASIGPYELSMLPPDRNVWYALPWSPEDHRLIAHLHGQCAPPVYSCGQWIDAGAERGVLICPTGNEHCNDSPTGPAMWDESFALMDQDLERSVSIVSKKLGDGGVDRHGAIMTGFSRGAWAAIEIVRMHPGRWPLLVLVEGDVWINKAYLESSKVRAVAMVAAEQGTELPGMRKSVDAMKAAGYPAELFIMPKTYHLYSTDIEQVMRQALSFVIEAQER